MKKVITNNCNGLRLCGAKRYVLYLNLTKGKIMKLNLLKVSLVLLVVVLQACGTAHVQPNFVSEDLGRYTSAYISKIDIQSAEQNNDSLDMNKKMEVYAKEKLAELIEKNQYALVTDPNNSNKSSLEFSLDLDIVYGSRAARYWAGFGAGKGSVISTFEVVDSKSGEVKYSSSGASDLAMGLFGGSMAAVIKQNIDKLINEYVAASK